MTLVLRDYQERAISDLWAWFEKNPKGNPLIVLPTGSGKSMCQAELLRRIFAVDPRSRVICVTHSRELVSQNFAELIGIWADAPAGVYSAGLNRRDLGSRIIFCSIQSVFRKAYSIQQCDLVIIDEAHMLPRKSDTMYQKFLTDLRTINPQMRVIGMTATPYRLESGLLTDGKDALFTDIAHETNVVELFDKGYLCPPRTWRRTKGEIDTKGVGTRMGEYIANQLEVAALDPTSIDTIADETCAAGHDRRGWLVFGVSVKHCEALRDAFRARGVSCEAVFGETEKDVRNRIIADFKAQKIRCLVSRDVLSIGFNARHCDLITLARPTKSTGLYIQQVGRGTRLSPETGKTDCVVLDFAGAVKTHGPFDEPFLPESKAGKGKGSAPFKECPECGCATGTASRACPGCGFEYPPPERAISLTPDSKPILSQPPEWLPVAGVSYRQHNKAGGLPTMRVEYRVGLTVHREWQCPEHQGFARQKFEGWWLRRAKGPAPATVEEAIARSGELAVPDAIQVKREGRYDRVINHRFEAKKEAA
ncbi:ATP-dependent DNA helicase [Synechococcus phage Yong-M3-232]|nr:ATP-dependent DNA helicase [Synechococcus phage Yong-M3-232]